MAFELPSLPYGLEELEPVISKRTLEFHHGKHHQAYVTKLNGLIEGKDMESLSLEEIIKNSDGGVFNNAAQVWNHTFYFNSFAPGGKGTPSAELAKAINDSFGSMEKFKEEFSQAAATLFGSGWAWLVKNSDGQLEIVQTSNAGNPLKDGLVPVLTCDVWEHAYYLDYQNKRPEYVKSFWDIIDWEVVSSRF